jgi:integrase
LRTHYEVTGSCDLPEADGRLSHLDAFFGPNRLVEVTPQAGEAYVAKRQGQGARNGSINCELAVLGRMLRLAHDRGQLARVPKITKPKEAAPRAGFVEDAQFQAIRRRLPEDLQAVVTIAFTYGWRRDEILTLARHQLDLEVGTLRLDVGTTKNDDGREVDLTDELRRMLTAQVTRVEALGRRSTRRASSRTCSRICGARRRCALGGNGGRRCSGSRSGISGGRGPAHARRPECRGC